MVVRYVERYVPCRTSTTRSKFAALVVFSTGGISFMKSNLVKYELRGRRNLFELTEIRTSGVLFD